MTDKEKWIKFLSSFGLNINNTNIVENKSNIDIRPCESEEHDNKISGDTWASFEVHFDDDGNFTNIEIFGD
jgi:hypothetical protein